MQTHVSLTPEPMLCTSHILSSFPFPPQSVPPRAEGRPQVYLNILATVFVFSQGSMHAFVKNFCSSLFPLYVRVWVLQKPHPRIPFPTQLSALSCHKLRSSVRRAVAGKEHMVHSVTVAYLL